MAVQDEALEKLACCALPIQYIMCSTVGRSIASIYDLSAHIGKYDHYIYIYIYNDHCLFIMVLIYKYVTAMLKDQYSTHLFWCESCLACSVEVALCA